MPRPWRSIRPPPPTASCPARSWSRPASGRRRSACRSGSSTSRTSSTTSTRLWRRPSPASPVESRVLQLQESVITDSVLGAVLRHADRAPDQAAVKDLERALTRGELRDAAGKVAAGLHQKGVEPGDRVALLIGNSVDFVVAALGCLWAGVTFVPLAITDTDLRRAQIVADCRPAQVITAGLDETPPSGLPVGTRWTSLSA